MSRTLKGKSTVVKDEEGNIIRDPNKSDSDTDDATTGCSGYTAEESSENQGDRSSSSPESTVNILEKTRNWKNNRFKDVQYDQIKQHLRRLIGDTGTLDWYAKYGEESDRTPQLIVNFECVCNSQVEYDISKTFNTDCKVAEEEPDEPKPVQENNTVQDPDYTLRLLERHNGTCNVRRASQYCADIAEYFIDEPVDPDLFVYTDFPKAKYVEDPDVYKYYALQERRRILKLKLKHGLKSRNEEPVDGMSSLEESQYKDRNQVRVQKYMHLNNFLDYLLRPYMRHLYQRRENGRRKDTEEDDDDEDIDRYHFERCIEDDDDEDYFRPRRQSKLTPYENGKDKRQYLAVRAEYKHRNQFMTDSSFEEYFDGLLDDPSINGKYRTFEEFRKEEKEFLDSFFSSSDNGTVESKSENENQEETDEPANKRKHRDSEQGIGEPEHKKKREDNEVLNQEDVPVPCAFVDLECLASTSEEKTGDSETTDVSQKTDESSNKGIRDSEQETGDSEITDVKETDEPANKRKQPDSEQETGDPETTDGNKETGEPASKRTRVGTRKQKKT